jgi:anti-sigma regulatory factor (Ser/Thr protein kinase)
MDNVPHERFVLEERSYLGVVKSGIRSLAFAIGFTEHHLGEVDIVVSEIATNLLKHTPKGGELLVKPLGENMDEGIEIISIDSGPGIALPDRMMQDGVSTSGTLGQGLGAIRRLSQFFDLYSLPGWGTIIVTRILKNKEAAFKKPSLYSYEFGALAVPKKNEKKCGDGYGYIKNGNHLKVIACDGLGHGPEANKAAIAAVSAFCKHEKENPNQSIRYIHEDIKRTRGAVAVVTDISLMTRTMLFCGVGNITARIISPGNLRNCISYNGIVGHNIPNTLNTHTYELEANDMIVLNSDGITSRCDFQKHVGIFRHDPVMVAAVIYKDCNRGTDDSMVVVIKNIKKT